jgi:hypothetical protein
LVWYSCKEVPGARFKGSSSVGSFGGSGWVWKNLLDSTIRGEGRPVGSATRILSRMLMTGSESFCAYTERMLKLYLGRAFNRDSKLLMKVTPGQLDSSGVPITLHIKSSCSNSVFPGNSGRPSSSSARTHPALHISTG